MPVYVRKNLLSITPESLATRSSDEEDYIRDPEQMYDELPQPFRLVNKIVNLIFDLSWEIISEREAARIAERSRIKPPQYDCAIPLPDYGDAASIADSPDGRYVFFGRPKGIAMIDAKTQAPVAFWEHGSDDAVICKLNICLVGIQTYLITAIDEAGVGRLLCCAYDAIHPMKTFNEDISGSQVINTTISQDGDYVAVVIKHGSEVWLDVWHLPRDTWLRELETAHSNAVKQHQQQHQQAKPAEVDKHESSIEMATSIEGITTDTAAKSTSSDSPSVSPVPHQGPTTSTLMPSLNTSQMSKPNTVLRVRPPPAQLTGVGGSASSVLKAIDEGQVLGLGIKQHLITDQHLDKRRQVFRQQFQDELTYLPGETSPPSALPMCMFLNPSFMLVTGLESSNDRPNSIAVAWKGSTNLCHYNLLKPSKDVEHKPDVVWPYGSSITCLASSPCTSLLAVGHQDGTLTVYDQHIGVPQSVQKLSSHGGIAQVDFLNPVTLPPAPLTRDLFSTPDSHLLVYCTDGSVFVVQSGYGGHDSVKMLLPPCTDPSTRVISVQLLTGIPQIVIVIRGDGEVSLLDVRRGHTLCVIALRAADCRLTAVIPAVLTPAAHAHMLYVKGVKEALKEGEEDEGEGCMFVFPLRSFPALDPFMKSLTDVLPYSIYMYVQAQKRFDSLLTQRLANQDERSQRMQQRWPNLSPQVIPCK